MMKVPFITVCILLIVCSIIGFSYRGKYVQLEKERTQQKRAQEVKEVLYKLKLTNWVFKNSERITQDTAKQIVEETFKVDHPVLVLAVINIESEFNPSAVSRTGAMGLGQIMYSHWGPELEKQGIIKNKKDLFGIKENIRATSYILKVLMEKSDGDIIKTLKLYLGEHQYRYNSKIFTSYVAVSALKD
jgi:hypothetical protein